MKTFFFYNFNKNLDHISGRKWYSYITQTCKTKKHLNTDSRLLSKERLILTPGYAYLRDPEGSFPGLNDPNTIQSSRKYTNEPRYVYTHAHLTLSWLERYTSDLVNHIKPSWRGFFEGLKDRILFTRPDSTAWRCDVSLFAHFFRSREKHFSSHRGQFIRTGLSDMLFGYSVLILRQGRPVNSAQKGDKFI